MRGFTLIEVMVSTAIILIFTAIGIAALRQSSQNEILSVEGKKLLATLRRLQTNSLAGTKPNSGCTTLNGYELTISSTSYAEKPTCVPVYASSTQTKVSSPITIVTANSPSTGGKITFKVLSQGTDTAIRICLQDANQENKYEIRVTTSGEIQDLGIISGALYTICDLP